MVKPLHEFGGWLKVCYVINILSVLVAILGLVSAGLNLAHPAIMSYFLRNMGTIIFSFLIILNLRKKDPSIPGKITFLIRWSSLYSLVFTFSTQLQDGFQNKLSFGVLMILIPVWYIGWTQYFLKSKRVLSYYGENAV
jgi:hypothetical protein